MMREPLMTFEEQVADALVPLLAKFTDMPVNLAGVLAPRIAAAIEAGGRNTADGYVIATANREAALKALQVV